MGTIAIVGASGAIGKSVAETLARRGLPFRVVGRRLDRLTQAFGGLPGVELCQADAETEEGLAKACAGADAVVYALGLPYTAKEFARYPAMMRAATNAAAKAGVKKFLLIENVYPYGIPKTQPVTESHPREPVSVKGRWRKEQEDVLLEAHRDGKVRALVLRLPDFYGPNAELSITTGIFDETLANKTVNLLGPVDTPHEFVFVEDVGPVVADLLALDAAWGGEVFHLAGAGIITMREFATQVGRAAGHAPAFRIAGRGMVRFLGLFMPIMRELLEMSYLQSTPVLLDDTKLRALLPSVNKTPYTEGIQRTVEEVRRRRRTRT